RRTEAVLGMNPFACLAVSQGVPIHFSAFARRGTSMAISGFGRGKAGEGISEGSPSQRGSTSGGGFGGLSAFIDQGSEFEGKLSFKDTVRIDGLFRGEISSQNTLVVGESGQIEASIQSTVVVVSGSVVGDIEATEQVTLHKTARVEGNLSTPSVVIEEGAVFNGHLKMKTALEPTVQQTVAREESSGEVKQRTSQGSGPPA
ncbi:polymer-forming cytoskeletal protein, partial [Myxococcota bacterium]|nr:polymer-forming cytoskeletal protein [Myxococcota bacterium]